MAAEAVIEALAVIDVEGGGLLLVKRAGRPVVATTGVGFPRIPGDFSPDKPRKRDAATQLIEEAWGKDHGDEYRLPARPCQGPSGMRRTERGGSTDAGRPCVYSRASLASAR